MKQGLGRPGRREEFFPQEPGGGGALSWAPRLETRPWRPASRCVWPTGLAPPAGSCRPRGGSDGGRPARCSPGAAHGSRSEAHPLLYLVPRPLPVCLHGPKPPEPGQQALLPPLCGQPAWRGTWGPGHGNLHQGRESRGGGGERASAWASGTEALEGSAKLAGVPSRRALLPHQLLL